jgi:hypothetical protein
MRLKLATNYNEGIRVVMTTVLPGGYGFKTSPTVADAADYAAHMEAANAEWEKRFSAKHAVPFDHALAPVVPAATPDFGDDEGP